MEKNDQTSVEVVGYWISLFVHRVRWALKLKGVEYEYTEEDIFNKTPPLSHLNPVYGKVPVLVHDGNPLPESAIILEYIDDVWSHDPLLPQDPLERAHARFWAQFADQKVFNTTALVVVSEGDDEERTVKLAVEYLERIEDHDGNPLPESAMILEYIDDVWSQDLLLPQDPFERAQARFWAK